MNPVHWKTDYPTEPGLNWLADQEPYGHLLPQGPRVISICHTELITNQKISLNNGEKPAQCFTLMPLYKFASSLWLDLVDIGLFSDL